MTKTACWLWVVLMAIAALYAQDDEGSMEPPRVADVVVRYDIETPAYPAGQGPIVRIDEGHNNFHTAGGTYKPFASFLERDGYRVLPSRSKLTTETLESCRILVISDPMPLHDGSSPFTTQEVETLRVWVAGGGSLFLITDHLPDPAAVEQLAAAFDITVNNGYVLNGYPDREERPLVFTRSNGTLGTHVITDGSKASEKIESVATFSGCAFQTGPEFTSLLVFGPGKKSWMPQKRYDFKPDTPTVDVAGWCQGAVAEIDDGKIAFFGEAAMFTAQLFGPERFPVGMNCPVARDNARFLLNIVHWLSGDAALPSVQTGSSIAAEGVIEPECARMERMAWWREARFGLFVHWGPVSLKGTEIGWSRKGIRRGHRSGRAGSGVPVEVYDNLYKEFNPTEFDAGEWVAIAKQAGMRYLVYTTKHHDGFVNFDSKLTDYKITSSESPFGRDIVGELTEGCRRAGLAVGYYYSQPDWYHLDYRTANHVRYLRYMHGQIVELLSNYGRIDLLWFDGLGGTAEDWDAVNLFRTMKALQPHLIINNRCGFPGDYDTPEQRIGTFQVDRPWETCMTICRQWAWKPQDELKSLKECIQTLVKVVGADGNLLLNVGPMPNGRIEPRQVERLREIGRWLEINGETIYGTRGGPFKPELWGASTHKASRIYVHVMNWPGDELVLPRLVGMIENAYVLGGGEVEWRQDPKTITLSVAKQDRSDIDTIVVLEIDRPVDQIPPVSLGSASLAFKRDAKASNVFQNLPQYGADKAFDGDLNTRWATDFGIERAWIEVDLGELVTFRRIVISEAYSGRVTAFELQYLSETDVWKMFCCGANIGDMKALTFESVTARQVRLKILEASEGPTIQEFQVFDF